MINTFLQLPLKMTTTVVWGDLITIRKKQNKLNKHPLTVVGGDFIIIIINVAKIM